MGNPVSYYNLHLTTHYFYCKIRFVFWKWWEKGNRVFALKGVCHVFLVQSCHPVLSSGRSVKYFLFEPKKAYRVSQKDAHFFWTTPVMIGDGKNINNQHKIFYQSVVFHGKPSTSLRSLLWKSTHLHISFKSITKLRFFII